MCFHDATLDRTTEGSGFVARTPFSEIARLDAGYQHRDQEGFPFRGQGIGVPTFASVCERFPDQGFILDLKTDGTEEPLARLIKEMDLYERVIVGSFSDRRLQSFRELTGGRVATSSAQNETVRALVAARSGGWNPFARETVAMQVPISWYGVPVVTERLADLCHRYDRLLQVWTINETTEMKRLFDLGVDAVITDRVDLARRVSGGRLAG
jgi:glycerophosphoryl diester phosphodiesterase